MLHFKKHMLFGMIFLMSVVLGCSNHARRTDSAKKDSSLVTDRSDPAAEKVEPVHKENLEMMTEEPTTELKNPIEVDLSKFFGRKSGCAVFFDKEEQQEYIYHEEKADKEYSPCSTFKIAAALAGLKEGVLASVDTTMDYSGKKYAQTLWNKNLTLKEAFSVSCVWYFRKTIDQIGQEKMQQYVDALSYGNCDLSSWQGEDNSIDPEVNGFWLESSLKISPKEQITVLRNIFENTDDYGKEIPVLKEIMKVDEQHRMTIYGKTGTGRSVDGQCDNAWFVGFTQMGGRTIYFAVHLDGDGEDQKISGPIVKEKVLKMFQSKKLPFVN